MNRPGVNSIMTNQTSQQRSPRPLDQRDLASLRALGASATWTSRDAIAVQLGKTTLDGEDLLSLDLLVSAGRIEKKTVGAGASHARLVYRLAQNGGGQ